MNVELPDGTVIQDVPDGTSKIDLLTKLQRNGYDVSALIQKMAGEMALSGMSGPEKFAAGAGKAVSDLWRGAKQLVGGASRTDVDETRNRDAALMGSGAGLAGNITGNLAAVAPSAFIPGVNTYTGAAALGGLFGAASPLGTGDSRVINTAAGTVAGAGGQFLGRALGRAIRPVTSKLGPEQEQLAQAAAREKIPLTAGGATGSKPVQIIESVMENLPMTSKTQLAGREAQQRAYTAAALRRAGMESDVAGAPELLSQKRSLGGELGSIAERNRVRLFTPAETPHAAYTDWQMVPSVAGANRGGAGVMDAIAREAETKLPEESAKRVSDVVNKILAQTDKEGFLSGMNYQGWREPLRNLAKGNDAESMFFGRIRRALDQEFKGQLTGADATAFEKASRRYANLKTIMDAMGGPGNLPATGQVAPAQLGMAVGRAMGREGKALGRGDLNELARVGQVFVKPQIPNSGTAERMLVQGLLTGAGGIYGGIRGGLGGGGEDVNWRGMVTGAGTGALAGFGGALLAPRVAQAIMNSPMGQAYLKKGIIPIDESGRKIIADALRTLTVGANQTQDPNGRNATIAAALGSAEGY